LTKVEGDILTEHSLKVRTHNRSPKAKHTEHALKADVDAHHRDRLDDNYRGEHYPQPTAVLLDCVPVGDHPQPLDPH
jgi:hypothetical protein